MLVVGVGKVAHGTALDFAASHRATSSLISNRCGRVLVVGMCEMRACSNDFVLLVKTNDI